MNMMQTLHKARQSPVLGDLFNHNNDFMKRRPGPEYPSGYRGSWMDIIDIIDICDIWYYDNNMTSFHMLAC